MRYIFMNNAHTGKCVPLSRRGNGITDDERLLVERRIREGLPNNVIAARTGLSYETIAGIRQQLRRLNLEGGIARDNFNGNTE